MKSCAVISGFVLPLTASRTIAAPARSARRRGRKSHVTAPHLFPIRRPGPVADASAGQTSGYDGRSPAPFRGTVGEATFPGSHGSWRNYSSKKVGSKMSNTNQMVAYTDLATFADYDSAQALVDKLSDAQFDVTHVRIVGNELRSVEQVTGRLTVVKAAGRGAASGAWFGAFAGAFFTFFSSGLVWIVAIFAGLFVGAVAGALYGAIAHALTHGRRDFSSYRSVEASDYTVMVAAAHAAEATIAAGL